MKTTLVLWGVGAIAAFWLYNKWKNAATLAVFDDGPRRGIVDATGRVSVQ